jgi:DNA invertase Pin-like site-specific DNA recombinase
MGGRFGSEYAAEKRMTVQQAIGRQHGRVERIIAATCKKEKISLTELRSGSRRGKLPAVRAELVRRLIEDFGVTAAEVARQLGISTSGVSKIMSRSLSS